MTKRGIFSEVVERFDALAAEGEGKVPTNKTLRMRAEGCLPAAKRTPPEFPLDAGCLAKPGRKRLSEAQTHAAIRAKLKARNAP
jgi:hypothetical protein